METSQVPQSDPMDDLSPELQEAVEGLAWLGHLEDTFEFAGHTFTLRTLTGEEELLASVVAKEYRETLGEPKAWVWAQLALALQVVDEDPDFCPPLGPDKKEFARARFRWVTSRWHWPVAEQLMIFYNRLMARALAAIETAQDLSARSLRDSWPSADFLTEQGTSDSETGSEEVP